MKKISFVVGRDYQCNRIFDLKNSKLNRDNCLLPFYLLKMEFEKRGYALITSDLLDPLVADLVIYNEMPKPFLKDINPEKSYLMIFETDLIRPDNWDKKKHRYFKKIFTWSDLIVDEKRYIKFNFPNEIRSTPPGLDSRPGFLTSISANKTSYHPLELYSKRLESIKWFERNHPDEFDYYGIGWDYSFNVFWQKVFRKLKVLNFFPKKKSPSYKGMVDSKLLVLQTYKFTLCYENGRDIPGYITEKIWDCFFAGTIPIYWGDASVTKVIPENCFIDRAKFNSNEDLYHYLKKLSSEEILTIQKNIENFLKSEKAKPFSNEYFALNIANVVLENTK